MIDKKHLPYLIEMRSLATDKNGEQILIGLSVEETKEYFDYVEARVAGDAPADDLIGGARYLALHEKHEAARFQILIAENELRTTNPTRN
jgi:hypothetical protein